MRQWQEGDFDTNSEESAALGNESEVVIYCFLLLAAYLSETILLYLHRHRLLPMMKMNGLYQLLSAIQHSSARARKRLMLFGWL